MTQESTRIIDKSDREIIPCHENASETLCMFIKNKLMNRE